MHPPKSVWSPRFEFESPGAAALLSFQNTHSRALPSG